MTKVATSGKRVKGKFNEYLQYTLLLGNQYRGQTWFSMHRHLQSPKEGVNP